MNTTTDFLPATNYNRNAWRYVLLGGFLAGVADFIYPTLKTVMAGGAWTRPWLGVATGLLGRQAQQGGIGTVLLGVSLHFLICLAAAALLYLIVKSVKWLPRHWIALAIGHGIGVLLVMNYVILPLSGIGQSIYKLEDMHVHAFWHILLVGLPTGFFVARALKSAR
jgi:hypothetical protein